MKHISVHIQRIIVCHKIEQMDTKGRIMKHSVPPVASHDTPTSLFRHSHSFNTFSYTTNLIHLKMINKKKNYTKIFLNPRGVKPLEQFRIIIQEEF